MIILFLMFFCIKSCHVIINKLKVFTETQLNKSGSNWDRNILLNVMIVLLLIIQLLFK